MRRVVLGFLLAWFATAAPAATVTVLDQSFYVTLTQRSFGGVYVDGERNVPLDTDGFTWAELGIPAGIRPELHSRILVDVLITADENLSLASFSLSCSSGGLCGSYDFLEGRFDGTTVNLSGGGQTVFLMSLSRFGGSSYFENDGSGGSTLPDGRNFFYESGFSLRATFTPVPLPAGAPLLAGALALMVWRGSRQPGSSAPRLLPVAGRCVPVKSS